MKANMGQTLICCTFNLSVSAFLLAEIAQTCFCLDCSLSLSETDKAVNKGSIQAYL